MEAAAPIPLPADLVMFTVGERVAAGRFPLWLAVPVSRSSPWSARRRCSSRAGDRLPGHARYGPRRASPSAVAAAACSRRTQRGGARDRACDAGVGDAYRGRRGRVGAERTAGAARAHPGQQRVLQIHLVLGLFLGPLATGPLTRPRARHWLRWPCWRLVRGLLAGQAAQPGICGLDGGRLPGVSRVRCWPTRTTTGRADRHEPGRRRSRSTNPWRW